MRALLDDEFTPLSVSKEATQAAVLRVLGDSPAPMEQVALALASGLLDETQRYGVIRRYLLTVKQNAILKQHDLTLNAILKGLYSATYAEIVMNVYDEWNTALGTKQFILHQRPATRIGERISVIEVSWRRLAELIDDTYADGLSLSILAAQQYIRNTYDLIPAPGHMSSRDWETLQAIQDEEVIEFGAIDVILNHLVVTGQIDAGMYLIHIE